MTKEQIYRQQMEQLGLWQEAFAPAVHQLATMERELSRTMKAWKATAAEGEAPSVLDDHYKVIQKQRAVIASLRDSLGLTPKALRRIRPEALGESEGAGAGGPTVLELVQRRKAGSA